MKKTIDHRYEMLCDKCQGSGFSSEPDYNTGQYFPCDCKKCRGTGKITWIDKIMKGDKN